MGSGTIAVCLMIIAERDKAEVEIHVVAEMEAEEVEVVAEAEIETATVSRMVDPISMRLPLHHLTIACNFSYRRWGRAYSSWG